MHSVVETPSFAAAAKEAGLTEDEWLAIVISIAEHPKAGDIIQGTGGARKIRFPGRGKGKSGGYRVITYYAADDVPIFLLDIYGKGDKADLTKAERNEIRIALSSIAKDWRASVGRQVGRREDRRK